MSGGYKEGVSVAVFAVLIAMSLPAWGQYHLIDGKGGSLEVSANLQMLSAYVDLPDLEAPVGFESVFPDAAGLGSAVGRLEWSAYLSDRVSVEMHNRFFWQSSTISTELMQQGFGVSPQGGTRFDTSYDFVDTGSARLSHDLDRLVVGVYFNRVDLYLGRQAISWGIASLFPVADRFAPLSPFELDTLQRRGVDAVRAITNLTHDWELDLIVADRGKDEPLALAARVERFGDSSDIYLGAGRFWERLSVLGGMTWLAGNWKVYGEAEGLYHLDDREVELPRVTLGAQRVSMTWQLGAELHFNGLGAAGSEDYGVSLESDVFQRGESYFLGQYYGGLNGLYSFESGWGVGGAVMSNLADPSVVVFPTIQYQLQAQMSLNAGAYLGFGSEPDLPDESLEQGLTLNSEYGSFADMYFVQMTAFF